MKLLTLTNMYPTPQAPAWGTFVRDQVESLRKEGVEIDVLLVNGKGNKLNYLWGLFRFWARLLTKHYDLIHASYVFSGFIARTQFLCPVVLTHHGHEVFQTWERFPSRIITPLVDRVIVRSQEMKDKLGFDKAEIIPAGINLELFRPLSREEVKKELNLPREKKLVLLAGHYSRPEKRLDIARKAIALAGEKDPSIELMVVSNQPHDVIPLYMNACDVLLLVSDGEGSPNVVKEAMACNLPVVSVTVGDVPDIIGGTDGCYLCSHDPADVAEKLLLALNPLRRTNGRDKIKHLEQSVIAKRILALYQDVLSKKKHRQPEETVSKGTGQK